MLCAAHAFLTSCPGCTRYLIAQKLKRARAEAAKQIADSKGANAEDASSSGSGEDSGSDDGAEEHRPRVRSSRRRDSKEKKGKKALRKEGRKAKHKKDKDKERPQKRGREERPKAKLVRSYRWRAAEQLFQFGACCEQLCSLGGLAIIGCRSALSGICAGAWECFEQQQLCYGEAWAGSGLRSSAIQCLCWCLRGLEQGLK